jgi:hypothetical protein
LPLPCVSANDLRQPSPQSPQLSDRPADRDGFDGADLANHLEVHCANLACGLNDLDVTQLPNVRFSREGAPDAVVLPDAAVAPSSAASACSAVFLRAGAQRPH